MADTLAILPEHRFLFALLDVSLATGKPALICGPDISGKASAATAWCRTRGRPLETRVLTPDCTAEDLFGHLMPMPTPTPMPTTTTTTTTTTSIPTSTSTPPTPAPTPPFRWVPGPVTRAMESGAVLLLRGIDAPPPAVLEALNAVLELDSSQRSRSVLVNGRSVVVRRGFFVVCTSRESQHVLTPALASRFLAISWGGEEGLGSKLIGRRGFETLVEAYTRRLPRGAQTPVGGAGVDNGAVGAGAGAQGGEASEAVRAALAEPLQWATTPGAAPRYPLGETCAVLRSVGRWWLFMTSAPPFGAGLEAIVAARRVGDAARAIANLLMLPEPAMPPATSPSAPPLSIPPATPSAPPSASPSASPSAPPPAPLSAPPLTSPSASPSIAGTRGVREPATLRAAPLTLAEVRPELTDANIYELTGFALSAAPSLATAAPSLATSSRLQSRAAPSAEPTGPRAGIVPNPDAEPNPKPLSAGPVDSRRLALDVVLTCIKCAIPLILEGPAGVGKTKLVEVAYRLLAPSKGFEPRAGDANGDEARDGTEGRGRAAKVNTVRVRPWACTLTLTAITPTHPPPLTSPLTSPLTLAPSCQGADGPVLSEHDPPGRRRPVAAGGRGVRVGRRPSLPSDARRPPPSL